MKTNQLIQSANSYLINALRVNHGATVPTSPNDGDLWWEPGALYPQPWEWVASDNVWLSGVIRAPLINNDNVTAAIDVDIAIPFYNVTTNKCFISQIAGFIRNKGVAHNSTNGYNFASYTLMGTGAYDNLYILPTNTMTTPSALGANGIRRVLENCNLWIPGNAWTYYFSCGKTGSPAAIEIDFSMFIRYGRP